MNGYAYLAILLALMAVGYWLGYKVLGPWAARKGWIKRK